jgi:hypothetical protein
MKKIFLFVILAVFASFATKAQDSLHLSAEQSKKVEAINTEFKEGLKALQASDASKMQKYKKYKSLQSDKDRKMKEILTKDQFTIYKEKQAKKKEEFRNKRNNQN